MTADAPAPRSRRRLWIALGALAVIAIAVAVIFVPQAVTRAAAEARYADALERQHELVERHAAASDELTALADPARAAVQVADAAGEAADALDAERVDAVAQAADPVRTALDGAPEDADAPAAAREQELDDVDELNEAAAALEDEAETLESDVAALEGAAEALESSAPALDDEIAALRETIPARAEGIEEDNISAQARTRIEMHHAADLAATSEDDVAYYVEAYGEAARAVVASQESELAEKDQGDGLQDVRLEIEEFVRSIAGDARVDFDWSPLVNGLGEGESAGGYTTWWYSDGGYATMELSNSIARFWPDERFVGLVVHETGHAITSQCREMLDETFDGDVELMATAWAIGMGYDNPWGNGVDYYYDGVPPADDLVEASKACR